LSANFEIGFERDHAREPFTDEGMIVHEENAAT